MTEHFTLVIMDDMKNVIAMHGYDHYPTKEEMTDDVRSTGGRYCRVDKTFKLED